MSRGYNKVLLMGGLTKDPELKHTNNGTAYLRFSLACGYSVKDSNGQWTDKADYVPCTAWGNSAETLNKYCVKGSQLFVEGKVFTTKFKDKNGNDIWDTGVRVDNIRFAGGKRKDDGGNGGNRGNGGNNGGRRGGNDFKSMEDTGHNFGGGPNESYDNVEDIPF